MIRHSLLVASVLLAVSAGCKKDQRDGLPPAQDWGNPAQPGSAAPAPGASPHAGGAPGMPANPHGAADPHGGMVPAPGGNPHEGTGQPPPMAQQTDPKTLPKRADGRVTLGPFSLATPKGWAEKPITSSMRAAHFALPAQKPGLDAELIVYYFGPDGAGSDEDNISRWLEQITQPDGKVTKDVAKIEKAKFAGQDATLISVTGKYTAMAMGGTPPSEVADGMMLAAIVKSPAGPYYFKLTGAKATVTSQAAQFRSMLGSLKIEP